MIFASPYFGDDVAPGKTTTYSAMLQPRLMTYQAETPPPVTVQTAPAPTGPEPQPTAPVITTFVPPSSTAPEPTPAPDTMTPTVVAPVPAPARRSVCPWWCWALLAVGVGTVGVLGYQAVKK